MSCNKCGGYSDPCNKCNSCNEIQEPCDCVQKDMSTDCVVYTGDDLECSGIEQNTVLTNLIQRLDKFICDKVNTATNFIRLKNIGNGTEVYEGDDNTGAKQLRSFISGNTDLLDVVQNPETIEILPGTYNLTLVNDIITLTVQTNSGTTTVATIDITQYAQDTFAQDATFNISNQQLTIDMNSVADHLVDLSFLNNHLESVVFNSGTEVVEFTITDGTVFNLDIAAILQNSQVQSDFIESNSNSPAFIKNKNATKTVALGVGGNYNVLDSDNNYVIEIDNGANDVTVNLGTITLTDNCFIGFIQKGTGLVTFTNADIVQLDYDPEIYGQGHQAGVEVVSSTKYLFGNLKQS